MTQAVAQVRNIVARSGFANPLTLGVLVSDADYAKVYADDAQLTNGVDYIVIGIGDVNGVEIEIIGADNADNYVGVETFTALYDPPLDQQADISAGGVLGRAFESGLDQQNRRMQALGDRVDRSLKLPISIDGDIVLPRVASSLFGWDSNADAIVVYPVILNEDDEVEGVIIGSADVSVDIADFGAVSDDLTDDTAAVQAAIDYVIARGGGEVYISGSNWTKITSAVRIGSNVHLRSATQSSGLKQYTDNVPIIQVDLAVGGQVSRWSIRRLKAAYATQQTAAQTGAAGLYLGGTGVIVSRFIVEEFEVQGACYGAQLPNVSGCSSFLGRFVNCNFIQCASWGFLWLGSSSASSTNIEMRNVWVTNTAGQEIVGSRGFQIARMQGLSMDNCGCDHVQGQCFLFSAVRGSADTLWAESCDLAASSGSLKILELSGARLRIGYFYALSNTITLSGTADCYMIYANSSAFIDISILDDDNNALTDTSSGAYYTANCDSTSYIENASFRYSAHATLPVPNANLSDNNTPKRIRRWGGTWRGYAQGSATYDPASLADGEGVTTTVTVSGAALGDFAIASFSNALQGVTVTAWVSATDTVSVRFQNESGGVLDLASGTLRAGVLKI